MEKLNYKLQTEVYTIEQYMDEMHETQEEMYETWGPVRGFIWAMLFDEHYAERLFGPVYTNNFVGHTQATQAVTLELLQNYFQHRQRKGMPVKLSKA